MKLLPFLLIGVLIASGCTTPTDTDPVRAEVACTLLCKLALEEGRDLSAGPCLDEGGVPDWVCDVAHDPRTPEDNDPVNQCPSFGSQASHFVELDPNCEIIRTV